MPAPYFANIGPIRYEGPESRNPLAYRWYDADRMVLGRTMAEHLRIAVCYWHTFCFNGADMFGVGTFERPWNEAGDPLKQAEDKLDAAMEFIQKLGVPCYTFHDRDLAPEPAVHVHPQHPHRDAAVAPPDAARPADPAGQPGRAGGPSPLDHG